MQIILTEDQRLLAEKGQAVEVVDSTTNQKYMVTIQRVAEPKPLEEVPEGIRLSIEAFKRDLPELLSNKKTKGRWVAYNRVTRLGIARTGIELEDKCVALGLPQTEFYVGWIDRCELNDDDEIEYRPHVDGGWYEDS